MKNLNQLQAQAEKNQDTIEKLQAKFAAAENAVMQDPENSKAALEAAAFSMQITGAQRALEATQAAIEEEKRRLYAQEVQVAQAKITDLEKRLDEIREAEMIKMHSFFKAYQEWQALVVEHERTAQKYDLPDVRSVMYLDQGSYGMTAIKHFLDQWRGSLPRATRERLENQSV